MRKRHVIIPLFWIVVRAKYLGLRCIGDAIDTGVYAPGYPY